MQKFLSMQVNNMKQLTKTSQTKGKTIANMKLIDGDDHGQWCVIKFTDDTEIKVIIDYPPDRNCSILAIEK